MDYLLFPSMLIRALLLLIGMGGVFFFCRDMNYGSNTNNCIGNTRVVRACHASRISPGAERKLRMQRDTWFTA